MTYKKETLFFYFIFLSIKENFRRIKSVNQKEMFFFSKIIFWIILYLEQSKVHYNWTSKKIEIENQSFQISP